jgi:hypothetical protein
VYIFPVMSDGRVTLTKQEFEQLLQRAAQRHTLDEPRVFTEQELVEAGQELGIDSLVVRRVYQEHERELSRPPGRQRPFDSTLRLEKSGDTLYLTIPPTTGKATAAGMTGAVSALVASIAAVGSPAPLLALAGGGAALVSYLAIRSARTTRELRLNRDGTGVLGWFRGKRGRGTPLKPGQLHVRLGSRMLGDAQSGGRRQDFLALDHGTETFELLHGYSHAEYLWVKEEIERWLGQ